LKTGAENDGYLIGKMAKASMPANLFITAHSMGGLVARDALRQFDGWRQENFQQLVTWGTPHHGSPLITLGYLLHGPYQAVGGGPSIWVLNQFLGGKYLNRVLDQLMQLDTPGERDLRWDNVQPLRLNELFSVNTAAIPDGHTEAEYNLSEGSFLYNENLSLLNRDDPYQNGDRYYFLYGVTIKTINDNFSTGTGATMIMALMQASGAEVPGIWGTAGQSDGAVPLASMAGLNITDRSENLGNVDHEEYYHPTRILGYPESGERVAEKTFEHLELPKPRCTCTELELDAVENQPLKPGDTIEIKAHLKLDPTLDPAPGKRVGSAEALFYISDMKDEFSLGDLAVSEKGELSGSFSTPDLGEGNYPLIVRAIFKDDTQLESLPQLVALVYEEKTEQPTEDMQTGGGKWVLTSSWPDESQVSNLPGMTYSFSNGSASASAPFVTKIDAGGEITGIWSGTNSWSPPPATLIPGQSYTTSLAATSTTTAKGGNSSSSHHTTLWVDSEEIGTVSASSATYANADISASETFTWTVEPASYSGAKLGITVACRTVVWMLLYNYEYTWQQ
jgi:hypothetical protein